MKTIGKLLELFEPLKGLFFGVEMELEGITRLGMSAGSGNWNEEHDGSLRENGREFIFKRPATLNQSKNNLRQLRKLFEHYEVKPIVTNRASTHIHVNVADMNLIQFIDFVALIMVFEKSIAINSGIDRYNNYFALGTEEADYNLIQLMRVKDEDSLKMFLKRNYGRANRYAGINFCSVPKFGSLELRFLGAKANPEDVIPWLEFYGRLHEKAMKGVDWQFIELISDGLIQDVLDELNPPFVPEMEDIMTGIRNAQNLFFYTTEIE